MPVVYKITNKVDGKTYVGQAKSFKKRSGEHLRALRSNTHWNTHLQASFNKNGFENFTIDIIEHVEHLDKLTEREQHWVDYYKCYEDDKGYNFQRDVRNPWYGPMSDETKKKLSLAHTGKKLTKDHIKRIVDGRAGYVHSEETKRKISKSHIGIHVGYKSPRAVEIEKYNKNMELIKTYGSISDASLDTGVHKSGIVKNARGYRTMAGGFIWKYKNQNHA